MFCSKTKLEACAAISVIEWNTGAAGTNNFFKKISVNCGINTFIGSRKPNDVRILADWQQLKKIVPVIENFANSSNSSVKEKVFTQRPTNLEHLVLRSSLILIMKLILRKKPQNLYLLMRQKLNYSK